MQRVNRGGLCALVLAVFATACINASTANPPLTTVAAVATTEIVPVTTAPQPTETATSASAAPNPPTVVVPKRPGGLDDLNIPAADLADLTVLTPVVEDVLPHDRTAVTEGLTLLSDNELIESTGFYGRSTRRIIDLTEGDLGAVIELQPELYGTGITLDRPAGDAVGVDGARGLQFTRLEERVQLFDPVELTLEGEIQLAAEVNGACALTAGRIVASTADGDLQVLAGEQLTVTETIRPLAGATPLPPLLDLSCASGSIWAIVNSTGVVAEIDADSGAITSLADLSDLTPAGLASTDVLSGIAYRPSTDTWFVTGKRWDVLYEITLAQ